MRALEGAIAVLCVVAMTRESSAQRSSAYYSSASPRRGTARDCPVEQCLLPAGAIVFGAASSVYVGAWAFTRGELPVAAHVAGALAGGASVTFGVLYATSDPAPRYQTFGAIACLASGVPALILGLHGLIASDTARDELELRPRPAPKWYGRVGPSAIADARGVLSPALAIGGGF